jgi:hypothetical protein
LKDKHKQVGFKSLAPMFMGLVLFSVQTTYAEKFADDFSYLGSVDSGKWNGPWGDTPQVNSEYCGFRTSAASIISAKINVPTNNITAFDFRRPDAVGGNTLVHLYEVYPFGGVFALDISSSAILVYAMQSGVNVTVKQIPLVLNTWYHVVASSHADQTTSLQFYKRVGVSLVEEVLVDEVTYGHDPAGPLQFRVAASCNLDLDNVSIVSEPVTCPELIAQGWGLLADLNGDCYVDFLDLALLAQQWLNCIQPEDANCVHPWE